MGRRRISWFMVFSLGKGNKGRKGQQGLQGRANYGPSVLRPCSPCCPLRPLLVLAQARNATAAWLYPTPEPTSTTRSPDRIFPFSRASWRAIGTQAEPV